jgi:hypothetical protein
MNVAARHSQIAVTPNDGSFPRVQCPATQLDYARAMAFVAFDEASNEIVG